MVRLDLAGAQAELIDKDAVRLRDAAAAAAGRSSAARDLSLLLDHALAGRRVALHRGELHTLIEIAANSGLDDVAETLRTAARPE